MPHLDLLLHLAILLGVAAEDESGGEPVETLDCRQVLEVLRRDEHDPVVPMDDAT